jgi:hypothetical protein
VFGEPVSRHFGVEEGDFVVPVDVVGCDWGIEREVLDEDDGDFRQVEHYGREEFDDGCL